MRVWYDTEFLELGAGSPLHRISIGMVREDDAELYLVDRHAPWDRIYNHPWLREHVLPHLPMRRVAYGVWKIDHDHPDADRVMGSVTEMREAIREFLEPVAPVELWAWYGAYDHVVLAQTFGAMIDLPPCIPMWTNDVRQETQLVGNPELPPQDKSAEHNALADARWLRDAHQWLRSAYGPL